MACSYPAPGQCEVVVLRLTTMSTLENSGQRSCVAVGEFHGGRTSRLHAISHPFRWFPEFLEILHKRSRTQARLLALPCSSAWCRTWRVAFSLACQLVFVGLDAWQVTGLTGPISKPVSVGCPRSNRDFNPWLLLLIPPVGGSSAAGSSSVRPEAEGHGTDSVIAAYHHKQGAMRGRVPLVKMVASASPWERGIRGREGPMLRSAPGFVGHRQALHMAWPNAHLLAAGMSAGIAAIFRALWPAPCSLPKSLPLARVRTGSHHANAFQRGGLQHFGIFFGWEPLF